MSEIFGKFDTQDLNRKSALDIFEKLRTIRQGINKEFIARRFIWELIQNAKDNVTVCNEKGDNSLELEITLSENEFKFSHNKGYFKNENIRGLIRRYSSSDKDRDSSSTEEAPHTTGRFGTGFMTTHLLSEKVDVKGIFQVDERTYIPFELNLDRTGHNVQELMLGIEKSFDSVEKSVKSNIPIDSSIDRYKTEFIYHLNNEGYKLSKISIDELKNTAAYSLINHPEIRSIKCCVTNDNLIFSLNKIESIFTEETEIAIYQLQFGPGFNHKYYASIGNEETKVILPIDLKNNNFFLLPVEKEVPKIFLDFPMIGTEDLHIPFVINSPFFEPTEPRDGISLTGGEDPDTKKNVRVIDEAFRLYNILLNYTEKTDEWKNLYHLANIRKPKEKDWVNITWYDSNYIKPTRNTLLVKSIVDTLKSGRRPITGEGTVDFPSSKKEILDKIWDLSSITDHFILPIKEHIHEWHDINWIKEYYLTLEVLVKWISGKNDMENLSKSLGKTIAESVSWLNEVLELVIGDENILSQLNQDKIKILPNQNGYFQFKSKLSRDIGIDENLKKVMSILGTDWKDSLLDVGIKEFTAIILNQKDQEAIIIEINRILNEQRNTNLNNACDYITALVPFNPNETRNKVYDFSKRILGVIIPEKIFTTIKDNTIWEYSDKIQTKRIVTSIATSLNIQNFKIIYSFESDEMAIKWLDDLITFLAYNKYDNLLNLQTSPILLNQNGVFKHKDVLNVDNTEFESEELKDISALLGYDFRNELLSKEIFLNLPLIQSIDIKAIAEKITDLIEPKLGSIVRDKEVKEIFKKLYLWFNKNKQLADKIFSKLYERKHRLIDDDEIALNLEKAEILDEIISETGMTQQQIINKLKELLRNSSVLETLEPNSSESTSTDGGLYPVGAEEDIQVSKSLLDFSNEKSRISVSQEAKDIILQTLRNNGFIVPDTLSIKYTIVDGVLSPNGKPIKIVAKSSKTGKIYFNPSEWLALTEPDSQLFVLTKGNIVRNVTLSDLESINNDFHMRFNTSSFVMTNLTALANFFRYLPYTHFIFDAPESTTGYLEQFGLSQRNPLTTELTSDDENLLH